MSAQQGQQHDDEHWMRAALQCAQRAAALGEVPVGCVIVRDGVVIGEGYNHPISGCDPTLHAEVAALRDAARRVGNYRLPGATLYVTIEPCTMCVGALIHARIARVVFGALEPRAGAVVSQLRLLEAAHFNHRIEVEAGIMADTCADLMQDFFRARRRGQ